MHKKVENIHKTRRRVACAAHYGEVITWERVNDFLDDTFFSALEVWYYTKKWGLANGQVGWANEPKNYIEAITVLDAEQDMMEAERMEKQSKTAKSKSPKTNKLPSRK